MASAVPNLPSSMFSLMHHHRLLLLLSLLLIAASVGSVHGLEEKIVTLHQLQWGDKSSSRISSPQRSRKEKGAIVLEIRHHSHYSGPIKNYNDYLKKLLVSDEARVSSLQSQISNAVPSNVYKDSLQAQIPLTSGAKLQTLNYIVTIGLGSKNMTVIVDTGSDLTWVQCKPCFDCYNQEDPLFDPSTSSSYQAIPCKSTTCDSLRAATGSTGVCGSNRSGCNYALSYGDGSYTRGVLSRERIDLGGTTMDSFIFGCGQSNRGLFGGTSGLMGLGRTQLSLISQTHDQFGGIFSYCLPTRLYNSSGSLVLGGDPSVYRNSTPISYTRMILDPQQAPFYFLNLTGVQVGGVALQASGFSNGKILIDSGTVITRLVPSVYNALKSEFVRQFSGYPSAPGFSILDTCFNLSSYEEVRVPTLRLEFEGGVELNVDVSGIFYFVKKDASQVCLAIASLTYEDQVGIIGNYQQKNHRVVYDTVGSELGFGEEICSYS
ncbi:aspartyl protease family protein At5g10770 [Elaeis guineensis]|uniref:Aspartyl protease family protein At5g10770 n=1 Tax=Elaeis guineensis var. tenera TaxID=51953 RepID=A0A6I9QCX4_ELAGV|nr:aspartyl protease family protein At5g10770 [Elaeis guineensis]